MAKTNPLGNRISALEINDAYTLPTVDGAADETFTTDGAGTVSWQPKVAAPLTYEEVTDATKSMAVNYCYGANRAAGVTFTLPATSVKGDIIKIVGIDGVWSIHQNAGQTIHYIGDDTITGVTGYLTSVDIGDCITLYCTADDTDWRATCSWGNFETTSTIYMAKTSSDGGVPSSLFLQPSGQVYGCGFNDYGQLGNQTTTQYSSPIAMVGNHTFIEIALSSRNSYGLKANGEVWSCGTGTALGDNTTTSKSSPVLVVGNHSFVQIEARSLTCYGLKANGEVWSWGLGTIGALGDNTTTSKSSPVLVVGNHSFVKIAAIYNGCLALKANGEVWSWGNNQSDAPGQLGDQTISDRSSPVLVVGNHSFVDIAGWQCSYGLKANGEVWAWGRGDLGQLGDNTTTSKSSPVLVVGNHSFVKINAFCALKANGEVWNWGINSEGQLGDNTTTSRSSPVLVVGNHSFVYIHKELHALALKENRQIWSWGRNTSGALGDNTTTSRSSPVLVVGIP